MSFFLKGISSWVKPILKPIMNNHSFNIVREMANHRHKKIIKLAKGFRGRANRCYTVAFHRVQKARQYAYRDRKVHIKSALIADISSLCDDKFLTG
jgi:hypothetical protein